MPRAPIDRLVEYSRIIAELVPDAELLVVPGANHGVHIERPDIVLNAIRKLLALPSQEAN